MVQTSKSEIVVDGIFDLDAYYSQPEPKISKMLTYRMLTTPLRQFVIDLKDQLRKTIIRVANKHTEKFGPITKETTAFLTTHTIIDIEAKLLKYEGAKRQQETFGASLNILAFEYEHDSIYRWRFDFGIEEIVLAILDGRWSARPEGFPNDDNWLEPEPYGGRYSIVQKLIDHRAEIKRMLGVE